MKIAFQREKMIKKGWPTSIIGKEPFLRTGLSVIESVRNFKTFFCSSTMKVCQVNCYFSHRK